MSISEKRAGFTATDQEEIATKFQRLADDRSRRSGLGFSTNHAKDNSKSVNDSDDEKAKRLKSAVQRIMKDTEKMHQPGTSVVAGDNFSKYKLYEALNDEETVSLEASVGRSDVDSIHNSAIFGGDKVELTGCSNSRGGDEGHNSSVETAATGTLPLYKKTRVGDRVKARYEDGKFYDAEVVAVVHGGYTSAKFDIKFNGYTDVVCVSWRDVLQADDSTEEKNLVGREVSTVESAVAPAKKAGVDEFGRELRAAESPDRGAACAASQPTQCNTRQNPPAERCTPAESRPCVQASGSGEILLHPFLRTQPKGAWKSKR